eukprot:symbB.v1.2.000011.t1/scaffold5.1/size591573/11
MDVTSSTRAATALASLEAVPKILSIHEVQRAPISSPAGTTPRFSTTPPTPGSPEMSRVNSARRLGDDVVALEDPPMEDVGTDVTKVGSPRVTRPEKVDFLSEFDPFADTDQRTTPSAEGFAELDLAAELCAAFESSAAPGGRIETPRDEAVARRSQRLIAELPERSQVPSDVPDAQVPEVQQVTERPPRLVAELSTTSQAPEESSRASRLVAELSAPRSREVAGTTLRPLPDGCELDAPNFDLSEARGRRWEEGQHRRGRSLDASVRDSALDLRRSIPQTWDIQEVRDVGASSQLRSRSVEDVRSQEAALARVFPMPEVEAPSALQAWKPQDAFIAQEAAGPIGKGFPWGNSRPPRTKSGEDVRNVNFFAQKLRTSTSGASVVKSLETSSFVAMGSTSAYRADNYLFEPDRTLDTSAAHAPRISPLEMQFDSERLARIQRIQARAHEAEMAGRFRPGATVAALCLDVPNATSRARLRALMG